MVFIKTMKDHALRAERNYIQNTLKVKLERKLN